MTPPRENGSVTHKSIKRSAPQVTVTVTRDELWDMIAHSFDKADGTDFDDEAGDYHDYYWCVTDDLFMRMKNHEKKG